MSDAIRPEVFYTLADAGRAKGYSPSRMRQFADAGAVDSVRLSNGERVIPGHSLARMPAKGEARRTA